jgi:hypothetical protein
VPFQSNDKTGLKPGEVSDLDVRAEARTLQPEATEEAMQRLKLQGFLGTVCGTAEAVPFQNNSRMKISQLPNQLR